MSGRVTVLMAVRDGERYVGQSVESILAQTFADFELLVVDDASTDATTSIVESFRDSRIRLLRNERNLGQVPSLNRGLREARGAYVARIDADDVCKPARLARQVDVLDAEPRVALVGTWIEAVDERGRRLGDLRQVIDDYVDFLYRTLVMQVYISHPSAMYRRDEVLALGGYDEATEPSEDKDLWRKLALQRLEARIVPEELVLYRVHDRQLSRTRAERQRRMDVESQERFLTELAPDTPVRAVRQLLAGDPGAWAEKPSLLLSGVDAVIAGARDRLELDDDEARRLVQRVTMRLLEVANGQPWRPVARAVAVAAIERLPEARRSAARRRHAAAFLRAPATSGVRGGARLLSDGARALPLFAGLHGWLSRSPAARRIYGRIVGGG